MSEPKVSICVPVYNTGKYVRKCLKSLVSQSLTDIEIICVNDGSTDNSLTILEEFAKTDKRIRIINQENKGLGEARNTGIKNARGEYIGFVDSDDFVGKDMYKKLYNLAKKKAADIAMCNLSLYPHNSDTSKKIWFNESKGIVDGFFLNKNTQPWNKIVSRKLIKRTNFSFYKNNGDGMFAILMIQANRIVSINKRLYNYRVGHSSMSTTKEMNHYIESINCTKKQIQELEKNNLSSEYGDYFDYRLIYSIMAAMVMSAKNNDKKRYLYLKNQLEKLHYAKNPYTKILLKEEFPMTKYIGAVYLMPKSYKFAKIGAHFC